MIIDFNEIKKVTIPNLNGGEGEVSAAMFMQPDTKIMISRIPKGSSIGNHTHITSSEVNYVISGSGKAVCDGEEEILKKGVCHYCPKNSSHSIVNTSDGELVLFTVVCEY